MEAAAILAVDLLVVAALFLIVLYLAYDKYRFQIERQFTGVFGQISTALADTPYAAALASRRKTPARLSYLCEIRHIPELEPYRGYFEVHNELARKFNHRLSVSVFRKVLAALRFRPYPLFEV